jgi:hypothetical protein
MPKVDIDDTAHNIDFNDIPKPKIMLSPEEMTDLLDVLDKRFNPPKSESKLLKMLGEQGTQRGLIIILTSFLVTYFHADADVVTSILTGAAMIYGTHDVITEN